MKVIAKNLCGKVRWAGGQISEGVVQDEEGNRYFFDGISSPLFDFMGKEFFSVTFDIVDAPRIGAMASNVIAQYTRY